MKRKQLKGIATAIMALLIFIVPLLSVAKSQKDDNFPDVDLASYPNKDERAKEFKSLIMNEIKRKDNDFYAKWCDNED